MAFEGLLGGLGPTLVREVTPHIVQVFANLGERFRKDSREIKASFDEEIAALARTHAALLTGATEQRDRTEALQLQLTALERKLDRFQEGYDSLARQIRESAEQVEVAQRGTRKLVITCVIFAVLAFGTSTGLLVLSILHR